MKKFIQSTKKLLAGCNGVVRPVIPALGKLRQEDQDLKTSLRPCLKKRKKKD
jgi:hypothetical protein